MLLMFAATMIATAVFTNKFYEFYYEALIIEGQRCQYTGTTGELAKVLIVNSLLSTITCGIYTPWAIVRTKEFVHSKVLVNGQPGRLSFHGDPASLLGKYILGMFLTYITCFIYGAWFANEIFAFMWENTQIDGRRFIFRRDEGGFLGTYIMTIVLSAVTCNLYYPYGICAILKWEAERVS